MANVATMTFAQARGCILEKLAGVGAPAIEEAPLGQAAGRVLAEKIRADRDYPPLDRSLRDGYAVCSTDLPGTVRVIGEVRAGGVFLGEFGAGEAVEIMTGAPVPRGADQVVMLEHAERNGDRVTTGRRAAPGEWINPRGSEARAGDAMLGPGCIIDYAVVALGASAGCERLRVYRRPRVAILTTGDEVIRHGEKPLDHQVRDSNAQSLAVQVERSGGLPEILPLAPDEAGATRERIEEGLRSDLLLVSGGVSAGKYDVVERALAELGAEFYFDRTLIQPGQPTVFGRARGTFFFGLPGNPVSTMVTYRVFAQAAVERLGGVREPALPFLPARLTRDFRHKPGLTRFLPAYLSPHGAELTPVDWQGSSDIAAVARANVFLVAAEDRESWSAGDFVPVLMK
jgi:molybdopterin molybdotransferase